MHASQPKVLPPRNFPVLCNGSLAHQMHASVPCQVDKLMQTVVDKHGRIDGIANCIGTVELTKPPHITSEEEFRTTMDNNVLTAFNTVKAAVRHVAACCGVIRKARNSTRGIGNSSNSSKACLPTTG